MSTTFIVDVYFSEDGKEEEEKKSIFVKVPLTGDSSKNFKQVRVCSYSILMLADDVKQRRHINVIETKALQNNLENLILGER